MPRFAPWLTFCLTFALLPLSLLTPDRLPAQRPPRYHLQLESGRRMTGEQLTDWHATASAPALDGTRFLEGDRLRSLLDNRLQPAAPPPPAFVEMFGGDQLPGRVVGFRRGGSSPFFPQPPLVLVEPGLRLQPPQSSEGRPLRILGDFVRRIVWQAASRTYQPGTAFFRDGRQLRFRAARFVKDQIEVLAADGRQRLNWIELAELHLPDREFWPVYAEELARLTPDCSQSLLHLQTAGGLQLTTTLSRMRAHAAGNAKDPARWFHGVQPAWSLDALWVPHDEIWLRRLLPPDRVPLSRLQPQSLLPPDTLRAAPRGWRMDRDIRGGPLHSGGTPYSWGIGVHADSRLAFSLPEMATGFRTAFGLDRIAGDGGCVTASVELEDAPGQPMFRSEVLVGSQQVVDTGDLPLPADRACRLVLEVQMTHENRPPGADPLNVRDMADWLEPLVYLDTERLRDAVRQRLPSRFAAWDGWTLESPADSLLGGDAWNELAESPGHFLPLLGNATTPLHLHRRLLPRREDQWLVVAAHRVEAGPEVQMLVQINGQQVAEATVPLRDRRTPDYEPLLVPLTKYHDLPEIQVQITQSAAPAAVHWQALAVVDQLPMLYRVFDEQAAGKLAGEFVVQENDEEQDGGQAYTGRKRLEVPPDRSARLELPGVLKIRERPAWGEYRFLRVAVRKSKEGQLALRWLADDDARSRSYDWGTGPPVLEKAQRIWNGRFNDQWILITRDLFADFGEFDVQGCELISPAGAAESPAQFDHLYLARHPNDFQRIEQLAELRTNEP